MDGSEKYVKALEKWRDASADFGVGDSQWMLALKSGLRLQVSPVNVFSLSLTL